MVVNYCSFVQFYLQHFKKPYGLTPVTVGQLGVQSDYVTFVH